MNPIRMILAWTIAAVIALLASTTPAQDSRERWYVVEVMDQPAGWMHVTTTREDNRVTTSSQMKLQITRAGIDMTIDMRSRFLETSDGKPILVDVHTDFGSAPTRIRSVFKDDGIEQTTTVADRETNSTLPPIEGTWLTPAASEQFIAQRLAAGAKTITLRQVDATSGLQPVTMTYSDITPTRIELMGRTVSAFKARSTNSLTPGMESFEYLDDRGTSLRSETNFGGMKFVTIAADRELALAKIDAPELMTQTFVVPDRTIAGARTLKRAAYVLSVEEGELALPPTTGSQRAERIDERTVRLFVDATGFTPAGEVDSAEYLASTSMADTTDEVIIQLRERALDGAPTDPATRAEALRRFVYRHVDNKSLGIGFASASEVARSCEGDCSEHGVLLAALLRADGIPSRVVAGLVYADQFAGEQSIFGYHMWTQALLTIDGQPRWVDLDPTLPGSLSYDATHIAISTSSLRDGQAVNSLIELAPLMGRLKIAVEAMD